MARNAYGSVARACRRARSCSRRRPCSRFLADAQVEAAKAVRGAIGPIAEAAAIVAERLAGGGRLAYAAAGSSGLMALADALELPGTYGIPRDRIVILIAGGAAALQRSGRRARGRRRTRPPRDVADAGLGKGDCLIARLGQRLDALCGRRARGGGAGAAPATIAIANNAGTPLLELAESPILLATPPELIAGSTRMGAGTAQKIALNMLSTLAAIHLGHVHDGYMVNLHADNMKLRDRAARIVAAIAGCDETRPRAVLEADRRLGQAGDPACRRRRRRRRRRRTARRDRPEASPGPVETRGEQAASALPASAKPNLKQVNRETGT